MKLEISDLKAFSRPLLFLLVLIILSWVVIQMGFSKISSLQASLEEAKKNETVLSQKAAVLSSVDSQIISSTDITTEAVPAENSALMFLSQLKTLSASSDVTLGNFKIGTGVDNGSLSSIEISFDADGTSSSVLNFIGGINNFLPLSVLDGVKLNSQAQAVRANISLKVYYSAFPQKLPALTDSLNDLTANEKETVTKLSSFTQPSFMKLIPSFPASRVNPFQ